MSALVNLRVGTAGKDPASGRTLVDSGSGTDKRQYRVRICKNNSVEESRPAIRKNQNSYHNYASASYSISQQCGFGAGHRLPMRVCVSHLHMKEERRGVNSEVCIENECAYRDDGPIKRSISGAQRAATARSTYSYSQSSPVARSPFAEPLHAALCRRAQSTRFLHFEQR